MVEVLVSAESDKLVIKALRTAILVAWFMLASIIVQITIAVTRECPKCPACLLPAEKP